MLRVRVGAMSVVAATVVALTAGVVTMLGVEVRSLRRYERQVRQMKAFPYAGQWVPTVRLATIGGDSVTVGETVAGRAQVLVAFSTTCQFCLATLPQWKWLTDSLNRDARRRFDVVWISASSWDSTRAYVRRHDIGADVAKMPPGKLAAIYKLRAVPLTVVLDRWGRVEHAHASVFANNAAMDSVFVAAYRAAAADSLLAAVAGPSPNARR
jgi:peroxiredoxin